FLAANIRAKQLYGRPGLGLSVNVNGQDIFIPGEHGQPAQILLNGSPASTKSTIKTGDAISLIEGQNGQDADATIRDIIDGAAVKTVTIDGTKYIVEPKVYINGSPSALDTPLNDRDTIIFDAPKTAEEIFKLTNNESLLHKFLPFSVHVNGKPLFLSEFSYTLCINGKPCKIQYAVQNGDVLTFEQRVAPTVQMIANQLNIILEDKIVVSFQKEQLNLVKTANIVMMNSVEVPPHSTVPNGAALTLTKKDMDRWIYQDVFRFSDWQLPAQFKGNFNILRNGQPATFDTEIFGGDQLEILLEEVSAHS
ncbi:MAG: cell division protein, partial [Lysinibacillus sp.]